MKLTPKQRVAYDAAAESLDDSPPGMSVAEWMFLAGYRLGFEAAREAAAKVCDHQSFNAETCAWAASADNCAAAIRAIPVPGGEK